MDGHGHGHKDDHEEEAPSAGKLGDKWRRRSASIGEMHTKGETHLDDGPAKPPEQLFGLRTESDQVKGFLDKLKQVRGVNPEFFDQVKQDPHLADELFDKVVKKDRDNPEQDVSKRFQAFYNDWQKDAQKEQQKENENAKKPKRRRSWSLGSLTDRSSGPKL